MIIRKHRIGKYVTQHPLARDANMALAASPPQEEGDCWRWDLSARGVPKDPEPRWEPDAKVTLTTTLTHDELVRMVEFASERLAAAGDLAALAALTNATLHGMGTPPLDPLL